MLYTEIKKEEKEEKPEGNEAMNRLLQQTYMVMEVMKLEKQLTNHL